MATFKDDGQNLILGLPFTVPYLDKSTIIVNKAYLQTSVRLIVIICTYLLFRPHLESLFRKFTGQTDPAAVTPQQLKEKVQQLSDGKTGKKVYAVAGAKGDARTEKTPSKSPVSESGKSGGSRRRKA